MAQSFLVSFLGNDGMHGSHVVELAVAPDSQPAYMELAQGLAAEYGLSGVSVLNCDLLPDRWSHPSRERDCYGYQLSYNFRASYDLGQGSIPWLCSDPIVSLAHVRTIEEMIRRDNRFRMLYLLSCKPLRTVSPEALKGYNELRKSGMSRF